MLLVASFIQPCCMMIIWRHRPVKQHPNTSPHHAIRLLINHRTPTAPITTTTQPTGAQVPRAQLRDGGGHRGGLCAGQGLEGVFVCVHFFLCVCIRELYIWFLCMRTRVDIPAPHTPHQHPHTHHPTLFTPLPVYIRTPTLQPQTTTTTINTRKHTQHRGTPRATSFSAGRRATSTPTPPAPGRSASRR